MPTTRPGRVWNELLAGNERFVSGTPQHPRQDVERRETLAQGQNPVAAIFGCADSRLAAEIIFDLGLGDAFVVRNAGQVASDSAIASLEYAVAANLLAIVGANYRLQEGRVVPDAVVGMAEPVADSSHGR